MTTPSFYKPPAYPTTSEIPLKPRSKWRQALLDAAYRDIDACTCHTDFVFAIVDHAKAWLAELNQWNKVPTNPEDLATWEEFSLKDPRVLLQRITPSPNGFIPDFWFSFSSTVKPGQLSLTNLPDVLPWTSERALPYAAGSLVKTVYQHASSSSSGHNTCASAILKGSVALKYVQRLAQNASIQPYRGGYFRDPSIDLLERRAVFSQTLNTKTQIPSETWLGRRMKIATNAVQSASTLRDVEKQVNAHMATWYAAAHKWENGPPDTAAEDLMLAYQADVNWSYGAWVSDETIGVKNAEGPSLRITAKYHRDVDPILLAKIFRQVPLGVFMDANESKLDSGDHESQLHAVELCMYATASSAYCTLGRVLTNYTATRFALDLPEDRDFRWHEKRFASPDLLADITPTFESLDL
jgi:hypothetical protein